MEVREVIKKAVGVRR
jgi:hypothetical protein